MKRRGLDCNVWYGYAANDDSHVGRGAEDAWNVLVAVVVDFPGRVGDPFNDVGSGPCKRGHDMVLRNHS